MSRDSQSDTSRTGSDRKGREAFMYDAPAGAETLADCKREYPDDMNATRGAADIGKIVPGK